MCLEEIVNGTKRDARPAILAWLQGQCRAGKGKDSAPQPM